MSTKPETTSTEVEVQKPSVVSRALTTMKNHKGATIAVASLVGLVGLSAIAARQTDSDSTEEVEEAPSKKDK